MRKLLVLMVGLSLSGCGDAPSAPDAGADAGDAGEVALDAGPLDSSQRPPAVDAPGRSVEWAGSDVALFNPERGFYRYVDIANARSLDYVRDGGDTLAFSYVRLDAYRAAPIAPSLLDDVEAGLDAARRAGLKVILRFAYNHGPWPDSEPDASLERVLAHIAQLEPMLRANEDVIALVQAGFIGAWGEWHTSTNGLDGSPSARRMILEALLDALPASRSTQLRYPAHKEELFGEPLTEADAFAGSHDARTGHHNDCFVSSDTDVGTYPAGERERWVSYLADDTRFVPMGGETCALFPARGSCSFAPEEMERLHFSFINRDYHPDVVGGWESGDCLEAIEERLGYRLVLVDGELPERVRPGGSFRARVHLHNEGYAAPFNPRPAWLVLEGQGERFAVVIPESDARRWAAGEGSELDVRVRVPAATPEGEYTLALWLPDASPRLQSRPEYAIRTANEGTWDAERGWNVLGTITLDESTEGSADPSASELVILP